MRKWRHSCFGLWLLILPALSWAAPISPKSFHTRNGIPVYFVQRSHLPMVDIAVIFAAGSVRDGENWGVANLTQELMGHETTHYSEKEIFNTLAETGSQLGSQLTRDMSVWTLRSLTDRKKLKRSVGLLHSILVHPTFPSKILARLRHQTEVSILQAQQDPMYLATSAFFQRSYTNNGYGHSRLGNKETLAGIDVKTSQEFYKKYYTAKNASIVLVGDLSLQQAKQLAHRLSRNMAIGKAAPSIKAVKQQKKAAVFIARNKAQTTLLMGQLGFAPYAKGYYARLVGNAIFGGSGLSSVLANEVREKRGLAYFARSQLMQLQGDGPFLMASQSRTHNTKKAYQTMLHVYHHFLQTGVTTSQLKEAKENLIGQQALVNVTNAGVFSSLIKMAFYHLPLNYFQTAPQKIARVSNKEILAAFSPLRGKPLVAVMVGKKNDFEK